jgi:hypothetical protein
VNRMRLAWAIIGVLLAACVAGVVIAVIVAAVTVSQVRGTQVNNTKTIDNTAETLEIIKDCTQPEGVCYQRGQDSTAEAVDNIGLLSTYAAACADQPDQQTAEEIRECVLELLDRPRPKR